MSIYNTDDSYPKRYKYIHRLQCCLLVKSTFCTVNLASILMTYVDSNTEIHLTHRQNPSKSLKNVSLKKETSPHVALKPSARPRTDSDGRRRNLRCKILEMLRRNNRGIPVLLGGHAGRLISRCVHIALGVEHTLPNLTNEEAEKWIRFNPPAFCNTQDKKNPVRSAQRL